MIRCTTSSNATVTFVPRCVASVRRHSYGFYGGFGDLDGWCIPKTPHSLSWVAFCGRQGTADEVVQMWQYVQRIDGDVRDVVLRLDNRMAKIYGRTWK